MPCALIPVAFETANTFSRKMIFQDVRWIIPRSRTSELVFDRNLTNFVDNCSRPWVHKVRPAGRSVHVASMREPDQTG